MQVSPAEDQKQELITSIRASAAACVRSTSLRKVARQIGFSPSGLAKFLEGAAPYQKSFRRLQAWYIRHQDAPMDLDDYDCEAALTLLTTGMREDEQVAARAAIIEVLCTGFGDREPSWLTRMRSGQGAAASAE